MLPKINQPTFSTTVPSTGKEIIFRPILVKEEKILLFAQKTEDERDITRSLKQVINNVVLTEGFDVEKLCLFDIEYLYLKIRAKSVDNIVKLSYIDTEDDKTYDFEIDLDKVEMLEYDVDKKIEIKEGLGMIMKFPSAALLENLPETENQTEIVDYLITSCIDKIYDEDEVHEVENTTKEELKEFIESLDVMTYDKIKNFFNKLPRMYYKIEYKNSLGNDRKIELRTLGDFFHWG